MTKDLANNAYAQRIAQQAVAAAAVPEEFLVDRRTYYHTHAGARFIFDTSEMRNGRMIPGTKTIAFVNHTYQTSDKREQDQLDLVADTSGSMIYTIPDSDVERALREEQQKMADAEVRKTAEAAAKSAGQQFDPNVPINQVMQQSGGAIVGMQNSLSGSQAVTQVQHVPVQMPAPPSVNSKMAELAALANKAKQ